MTDKTLEERIEELEARNKQLKERLEVESSMLKTYEETNKALTLGGITHNVTRFEVIDDSGRAYVAYGIKIDDIQLQDDNRTLKIFVKNQGNKAVDKKKHRCPLCKIEFISLTKTPPKFCSPDCEVESEKEASEKLPEVGKRYKLKDSQNFAVILDVEKQIVSYYIYGVGVGLSVIIKKFWRDFEEIEEQPAQE